MPFKKKKKKTGVGGATGGWEYIEGGKGDGGRLCDAAFEFQGKQAAVWYVFVLHKAIHCV